MSDESDIIQSVYAVAVEPERYDDLVSTWVEKLSATVFAYQDNPDDADSAALNEHVKRATKVISLLAASKASDTPDGTQQSPLAGGHPEAQPVMRVNAAGELIECNVSASQAYAVTTGSVLSDLPFDTVAQRTIHALVVKLLRGAAKSQSVAAVPLVHALRSDTQQTVYLALAEDPERSDSLYLTSTDIVWPDRLTTLMRDSFELTAAECEVGKALVEGASVSEIAVARHNSVATVRVHARSLFAKTATTSQREFIRMAIGLAALYPEDETATEPSAVTSDALVLPAPGHWQKLRLRDGRNLSYAVIGPAGGRTCLYMHDAIFGPTLPRRLFTAAEQANLQFIVPARQYWIETDGYAPKVNTFAQCAQDVAELADYLKLSDVLVVGRVLGATYGYEVIRNDPSRYIGMLGVTPALPFGEREDINRMAPHHRLLTASVGSNPTLLKFVSRAGMAIYDRFGSARLLRMVYRSSADDLALVESPEIFAVMEASIAVSGGASRHPFYHELKDRPSKHWHPGMELPVPFRVLLGENDPSARRRRAERMLELGVPVDLVMLPELGELFLYSNPEVVVEQIVKMLATIDEESRPVEIG